jgi:C_GCAxxG_C_C family probable redox protein
LKKGILSESEIDSLQLPAFPDFKVVFFPGFRKLIEQVIVLVHIRPVHIFKERSLSMTVRELLKARLEELEERHWDLDAIEARFKRLVEEGLPREAINRDEVIAHKEEILDRVQRRAEEYCYVTRNCARGSATALLETFGLGNMEIIRALAPFPGVAMTGGICGPVTGGLMAIGLYFSNTDMTNFEDRRHYVAAHKFLDRFEEAFGSLFCPGIQEFILGKYMDPMASPENREAFDKAHAREKCPLAPGMGARIAAQVIIADMEAKGLA